jgi:hypothetical protein
LLDTQRSSGYCCVVDNSIPFLFFFCTATGFKGLNIIGHHVGNYARADTNPNALAAATHRLTHIRQEYPEQLPATALLNKYSNLPTNTNSITSRGLFVNFPGEIYIVIASLMDIPETKSTQHSIHPHEQTLINTVRILQFLHNVQPTGIAYILANTPCAKLYSHIQHWLTPPITLDATPCGFAAYRQTRICQNIIPISIVQEKFNQLPIPTITINDRLTQATINHWRTHPTILISTTFLRRHSIPPLSFNIALPKFVSYPTSQAHDTRYGIRSP